MRIISGKAGGIALSVPKGEVRPTTDRVRVAARTLLKTKSLLMLLLMNLHLTNC